MTKALVILVSIISISCSPKSNDSEPERPLRQFDELPTILDKDVRFSAVENFSYDVLSKGFLSSNSGSVKVFKNLEDANKSRNVLETANTDSQEGKNNLFREFKITEPLPVSIWAIKNVNDNKFTRIRSWSSKKPVLVGIQNEGESIYGYVDSSLIYIDAQEKFAYAIEDLDDNKIRLGSESYSVGHAIALNKIYGPSDIEDPKSRYRDRWETTRTQKYCNLLDAAILLKPISELERDEFETEQEFKTRIAKLKLAKKSNNWHERIYFNWRKISADSFQYDIEKKEMTINVGEERYVGDRLVDGVWETRGFGNSYSGAFSSLDKYLMRGNPTGGQCGRFTRMDWYLKELPSGEFNVNAKEPGFDWVDKIGLSKNIKMSRDEGRDIKTTVNAKPWFFMWGLQPYEAEGERFYRSDKTFLAPFYFDARLEYMLLVDSDGKLRGSYFSRNYIKNFIDNDLEIQKHAYRNKDLPDNFADDNSKKSQLAFLFFNAIKEIPNEPFFIGERAH